MLKTLRRQFSKHSLLPASSPTATTSSLSFFSSPSSSSSRAGKKKPQQQPGENQQSCCVDDADALVLERALHTPGVFQILLHLLPTDQDERKLRLAWSIINFKRETIPVAQTAKARKIAGMFFHSGSKYEVNNVPSHLGVKANLVDTGDLIVRLELGELVKLPEVRAALEPLGLWHAKTTLPRHAASVHESSTSSSAAGASSAGCREEKEEEDIHDIHDLDDEDDSERSVRSKSSNNLSVLSAYTGITTSSRNSDLALMSRLERVIRGSESRHRLIELAVSGNGEENRGLSFKIRFVSVVDQFAACEQPALKQQMGKKIQVIFLDPGGMFHIPLSGDAATSTGGGGVLELARVEVLAQLCNNAHMVSILQSSEFADM